jgi:hypothetical protein
VALNLAGVSFMVPLGLSSAGAVRVGHAVGRRDAAAVGQAGWAALAIGVAFATCSALVMLAIPRALIQHEMLPFWFTFLRELGYDGPVTVKPSRSAFQSRRRDVIVKQTSEALERVWRAAGLSPTARPALAGARN